jgi:hypothetical protein
MPIMLKFNHFRTVFFNHGHFITYNMNFLCKIIDSLEK